MRIIDLQYGFPVVPDEYVGDESVLDMGTIPQAETRVIVLPVRRRMDRRRTQTRRNIILTVIWLSIVLAFVAAGVYIGVKWEHGYRDGLKADAIDAQTATMDTHLAKGGPR